MYDGSSAGMRSGASLGEGTWGRVHLAQEPLAAVLRVAARARRRVRLIRLVVGGVVAPPAGGVGGAEPARVIEAAGERRGGCGRLHGRLAVTGRTPVAEEAVRHAHRTGLDRTLVVPHEPD